MERYETLGLVGEGSYGTVLKCRHRGSGRLVAIKKFMDSDSDKTVKKIALREIKLLRKLCHENLVNLLEVWKRRRRWYLVFEFVERTLLDDLEQNPSGLDLNTSQQYLYQILRAAAFCHQQNIIHRDIKPENILISQGGVVKLCDFGFARTVTTPAEDGVYTDYVATRWYRAPELLVGDLKYGKPVDVWAVGCLLLEMLTGNLTAHHQELFHRNPIFSGVTLPESSEPVTLQERFPTITSTALDLAQSCLRMDPERRAECSELLEHPLFTQDCFHIRFLGELNAKIKKDHSQNSTLPKITKTPRKEKDEGNEKNQRGKDKKQLGTMNADIKKTMEKKDKKEEMETTKAKQPSKLSKTIRNTSEPLVFTKPSNMLGAKVIDNAARPSVAVKSISKSAKTHTCDLSEGTKTVPGLKDNNTVAVTSKNEKAASPKQRQDHLKTKENSKDDLPSSCSNTAVSNETEKNTMDTWRCSKSEPRREFGKSWNTANTKVPKISKITATDHPNVCLSPNASLESTVDGRGNDNNDHAGVTTLTIPPVTKQCKTATVQEHLSINTIPKTLRVPDKENKEDFAFSVSISATAMSLVNQTLKIYGSSSNEQRNNSSEVESDETFLRPPDSKVLIEKLGPFISHTKSTSTMTTKSQKTAFPTEERKRSDSLERNNTTNITTTMDCTLVQSTATPDHRTSTRSFVLHNVDTHEFDFGLPQSRCTDKPRHPGTRLAQQSLSSHITASVTAQVSDKNLTGECALLPDRCTCGNSGGVTVAKKRSDIHFPDLRSSVLPELRGRDGKHNQGVTKDQRRDKQPVPHISPSEPKTQQL
uniref:cyclin-dependent kinase-like 2 isoform X2 n=1 Tax=Monopterus albus TaxID=43700 RepID=UPI0009B3C417|nr:cyclin-dependent kinase-like 2 isoform X2 [Monopterus albus]